MGMVALRSLRSSRRVVKKSVKILQGRGERSIREFWAKETMVRGRLGMGRRWRRIFGRLRYSLSQYKRTEREIE